MISKRKIGNWSLLSFYFAFIWQILIAWLSLFGIHCDRVLHHIHLLVLHRLLQRHAEQRRILWQMANDALSVLIPAHYLKNAINIVYGVFNLRGQPARSIHPSIRIYHGLVLFTYTAFKTSSLGSLHCHTLSCYVVTYHYPMKQTKIYASLLSSITSMEIIAVLQQWTDIRTIFTDFYKYSPGQVKRQIWKS